MSKKNQPLITKDEINSFNLRPLAACIRLAITGGLFLGCVAPVYAGSLLPVPSTSSQNPFVGFGRVDAPQINGNTMSVRQRSDRAILNWKEFDIAKNHRVDFKQPGATSIVLNRIFDNDASKILGEISANGQVYLYNQNGFVFGKDSVVDVNTLVASALNISDDVIKNSSISTEFKRNPGSAALSGNPAPGTEIKVENGAKITVGQDGRLILAGPKVTNEGQLSAGIRGQIILAASKDKVYLLPIDPTINTNSKFSGLLVEVGNGGVVTNKNLGNILARQGNITLAGFAVNQEGHVSATTSTNINGSIRLVAREFRNTQPDSGLSEAGAFYSRDGIQDDGLGKVSAVSFGGHSVTQIVADKDAGSAVNDLKQPLSYLEAVGHTVHLQSGSAVGVPGGTVDMTALGDTTSRVIVDKKASIDVSGAKNITAPVTRNVVDVQVQSFQVRDAPRQRGGVLIGQTVRVDIRDKNPILDFSGALARIEKSIDERLGAGGTINLNSQGDIVVNPGSGFNISGGVVHYTPGFINTSQLLTDDGRLVDIGKADPNQHYQAVYGVYNEVHEKWGVVKTWENGGITGLGRFEEGYNQGLDAGALNIVAPNVLFNGNLVAGAASGLYQRNLADRADGGSLTIGTQSQTGQLTQDVLFDKKTSKISVGLDDRFPVSGEDKLSPLVISSAMIKRSGIQKLKIITTGSAEIPEDVKITMRPGGDLELVAGGDVTMAGDFYSAGGNIELTSGHAFLEGNLKPQTDSVLTLASTAELNVSGRWVNDFALGLDKTPSEAIAIDGGSVALKGFKTLDIQAGSKIKADGGAWLEQDNQLTAGKAGNIGLEAVSLNEGTELGASTLKMNGTLSAYGLFQGGSLSFAAGGISVGENLPLAAPGEAFNLNVKDGHLDIANAEGFGKIDLTSNFIESDLTVKGSTALNLVQKNRILDESYFQQRSTDSIAGFSRFATLTEDLRKPVDFNLNSERNVVLETGSRILGDKEASIALTSTGRGIGGVFVDGTIAAPAGSIDIAIKANGESVGSNQAIWLGQHAQLLATGTARLNPPDSTGRRTGEVLDGGDISLVANRGYLVLEDGSRINVSGTHSTLDLSSGDPANLRFAPVEVGSDAGKIILAAAQGAVLDGGLVGARGDGRSNGGRLDLTLDSKNQNLQSPPTTREPLTINVRQDKQVLLADTAEFGDDLNQVSLNESAGKLTGQTTVAADEIKRGGFDDVRFGVFAQKATSDVRPGRVSQDSTVNFQGDVDLSARARVDIDAANVAWSGLDDAEEGDVNINTAYFRAGTASTGSNALLRTTTDAPNLGGGTLTANTQWAEFSGASRWDRFNTISINSAHDIRTIGLPDNNVTDNKTADYSGRFVTAANLNLTASQLYPTTLSKYSFDIENNPNGQMTISGSGNIDKSPLSAGGQLTLNAPVINQDGVIKAPFGTIKLNAASSLTLGSGSLTSVSGAGQLVPFGNTFAGLDWIYPYTAPNFISTVTLEMKTPPEKKLELNAPELDMKKGSQIDVSGGGDLLAYEFQSGIGGTYDYLDRTAPNTPFFGQDAFAIVPNLGSGIAPYDHQQMSGFNQPVGSQVFLSGSKDLAAGFYTLLPSHYALLPGAYLVTPQSGTQDQRTPSLNSAGQLVVPGYRAQAGTGTKDARWSGFLVENGADVRLRSKYDELRANTFFTQKAARAETPVPLLPVDSGQVILNAETKLALEGSIVAASPGGRGARMDLSANRIRIVDELSAVAPQDTLEVRAEDLNNLKVDSLLLGGIRGSNAQTGATDVEVKAEEITFDTGAKVQVSDISAAATNQVTVKSGASITAQGNVNSGDKQFDIVGDGALLRVSGDQQIDINRTPESGAVLGAEGSLLVEAGANLGASKSMLLDSTKSTNMAGNINMKGGSLNLAANAINIGEVQGNSVNSTGGILNLGNQQFNNITVDELRLTSRNTINFIGNVGQQAKDGTFKPLTFDNLVLTAAGLAGFGQASDFAGLKAKNMLLQNLTDTTQGVNPAVAHTTGTGVGRLNLFADDFSQGNGKFNISGFDRATIDTLSFKAVGDDGKLNVNANLTVQSGYITADSGKKIEIDVTGHQAVFTGNPAIPVPAVNQFGGVVKVVADAIDFNTQALLPGGQFDLTGLTGDVKLGNNSMINLGGPKTTIADASVLMPGGSFSATSDEGKIVIAEGSRIDLRGAGGAASTGSIKLSAPKQHVEWLGEVKAQGGSAFVDVARFNGTAGFDGLAERLMSAGISGTVSVRARESDINQANGEAIKARNITLVSDRGDVRIAGELNADQTGNGGSVKLLAGDRVALESGAKVSAKGVGVSANGGKVLMASTDADNDNASGLEINKDSTIDVGGSANNGQVVLRALRTDSNKDGRDDSLEIKPVAGNVVNVQKFYAEGVKKYGNVDLGNDGDISFADIAKMKADTDAYMTPAAMAGVKNIHPGLSLRPGIEINYDGDLALTSGWDFFRWGLNASDVFFGKTPVYAGGHLNINVGGNFTLEKSISDGFIYFAGRDTLHTKDSWSYQLSAGADLTSADKSAVATQQDGSIKNMVLKVNLPFTDFSNPIDGHETVVRTGNGDIDINTSGDLVFEGQTLDTGGVFKEIHNTSIYTAGIAELGNPYGSLGKGFFPNDVNPFTNPNDFGDFPVEGGDLVINAGRNIVGALDQDPFNSLLSNSIWLIKQGDPDNADGILTPTSWGVNFAKYNQNAGVFGGGNAAIHAGGTISDLVFSMPTTGKQMGELNFPGDPTFGVKSNSVIESGGGQMAINAGGDIEGGVYYLGRGQGEMTAGGSIMGTQSKPDAVTRPLQNLVDGPQLLMGDTRLSLGARKNIKLTAVSDPLMIDIPRFNEFTGAIPESDSHFFSYGADSALKLFSLTGDIRLGTDTAVINAGSGTDGHAEFIPYSKIYPASLDAIAASGDVKFGRSLQTSESAAVILFPSGHGNLNILAKNNIAPEDGNFIGTGIGLSDVDPSQLPTAANPVSSTGFRELPTPAFRDLPNLLLGLVYEHASTPVHQDDLTPVRIATQQGDIRDMIFNLPKKTIIDSGRDLTNNTIFIQHSGNGSHGDDASVIAAGRDISYPIQRGPTGELNTTKGIGIQVSGSGVAMVKAGRNIDFGLSDGLTTNGNLTNPFLGEEGAHIFLMAGLNGAEPDYLGFGNLDPDVLKYAENFNKFQDKVLEFMRARTNNTFLTRKEALAQFKQLDAGQQALLEPQLKVLESGRYLKLIAENKQLIVDFVRRYTHNPGLSDTAALEIFTGTDKVKALDPDAYLALQPYLLSRAQNILYQELGSTGTASAIDPTLGNERGFKAIEAMFPGNHWKGDVNLFFSRIQTQSNGDISLLVPGGGINVGLPIGSAGITKEPAELGIAAQGKGLIEAFLLDDFNVNQSRVFALGGDDILIWSSEGDIDAGKGANSALSAPAPVQTVDSKGNPITIFPPVTSGSGIRTAKPFLGNQDAGNIFLFAPKGVVNASEAGIAGNNVTISATAVLGANNIQFSGAGTGVPASSSASVAAGLTGVSNLTANVSQMAQASADPDKDGKEKGKKNRKLGSIKVELLGFGDGHAQNSTEAVNKNQGS